MQISANALPFFADDHCHFAVGLQTHQPINHMHACLLQCARPTNVGFFVEAGFQFHQHSDLLAPFCGFEQGFDHRCIRAYAVHRLFDGEHMRIACRSLKKIDHGDERFIGMMEQNILVPDHIKNIVR